MTHLQMRRQIKRRIEELSDDRLAMVDRLLDMVANEDEDAATKELLAIPGFLREFRRAMRDLKQGRGVPWREVARKVRG